jgi:mRNA-degrading endonuclease YafQ of YafQ-DinJ toxin-antitoxin module
VNLPVLRTNHFIRKAKKYIGRNPEMAEVIARTIKVLALNPHDPKLKTHKLKGKWRTIGQ